MSPKIAFHDKTSHDNAPRDKTLSAERLGDMIIYGR
jgi:hypothetical protein